MNKTRVKDRNTREELQPDEAFLKSIEEQIAIIGSAAEGFRQEVIAYLWALSRRGERITYKSYEPLKEAIEKKLTESVRELSRIITTARTRDEEQTTKYNAMVRNLLDNGYCESCVDVVPQVRRQQPLKGLVIAPAQWLTAIFRPFRSSKPSAAIAAPVTGCDTARRSANRSARTSPTSSPKSRSSGKAGTG